MMPGFSDFDFGGGGTGGTFGDLVGLDFGGGGSSGGGGWLQSLLEMLGGAGSAALGGLGSAAGGVGNAFSQNPLAALQALGGLGTAGMGMYQGLGGGAGLPAPAQLGPVGPPLAGPYPRRGLSRADFQAQGLSGASPDYFDTMTNPQYQQNPYGYSFQPGAQDERRQVYA